MSWRWRTREERELEAFGDIVTGFGLCFVSSNIPSRTKPGQIHELMMKKSWYRERVKALRAEHLTERVEEWHVCEPDHKPGARTVRGKDGEWEGTS